MFKKLDRPLLIAVVATVFLGLSFPVNGYAQSTTSADTGSNDSAAAELAFWNRIKGSNSSADFKSYLMKYPNGMFYDPALQHFLTAGGSKAELTNATSIVVENNGKAVNPKPVVKKKAVSQVKTAIKVVKKVAKVKVKSVPHRQVAVHMCRQGTSLRHGSCVTNVVRRIAVANRRVVKKPNQPADGSGGGGGGGGGGGSNGGGWQ